MRRLGVAIPSLSVALMCVLGCAPPDRTGSLSVTSEPVEGAEIWMNGQFVGHTPKTETDLVPALYAVELRMEGYEDQLGSIQIQAGQLHRLALTLKQPVAMVDIVSNPPGATVALDGEPVEELTPLRLPVPVGKHRLTISKSRYAPRNIDLQIANTLEDQDLEVTLTGDPVRVQVETKPGRARLYVDDIAKARRTPVVYEIDPGLHVISVELEGYEREETVVELEPGSEREFSWVLEEGYVPPGMIKVSGGRFIMGSDDGGGDEKPMREVEVDTFYIDRYEVTNEMYQNTLPLHTFPEGQENYPVVNINWYDANDFAKAVGKRLPTEAEWEMAARGSEAWIYPWGITYREGLANLFTTEVVPHAKPVGSHIFGRSPFGCLDMAGNVWEWVEGWYASYPGNPEISDSYGQRYRVARGGGFNADPWHGRTSNRQFESPETRAPWIGFRCAASRGQIMPPEEE